MHQKVFCFMRKLQWHYRFSSKILICLCKHVLGLHKKEIPKKLSDVPKKRCLAIPKKIPDDCQAFFLGLFLRSQETCLTISCTDQMDNCQASFWGLSGSFTGNTRHFIGIIRQLFHEFVPILTLKLPGEGKMALPLNLNDKNIPNADFFFVF